MVFKLDAHIHCPPEKLEAALSKAIALGINGVVFTDYDGTLPFDSLSTNGFKGKIVLPWSYWDIKKTADPRILKVNHSRNGANGTIYVGKGQEVNSNQGHILALGIEKTIPRGLELDDSLKRIYEQQGISVFAHLFGRFSGGCGPEVFKDAWKKYQGKPLGLEENAQYFNPSTNLKARILAEKLRMPLFGNSDAHGNYGEHHLEIGKLHSEIEGVSGDNMFEDISRVMLTNPNLIKVKGGYNTFMQTASWWMDSIRKNGTKKITGAVSEALKGLRK